MPEGSYKSVGGWGVDTQAERVSTAVQGVAGIGRPNSLSSLVS